MIIMLWLRSAYSCLKYYWKVLLRIDGCVEVMCEGMVSG